MRVAFGDQLTAGKPQKAFLIPDNNLKAHHVR
ncbi:hypothetical protein BN873_10029 [Candidatus Competibacter denitrificans Run_A_D11]|uniref:Uncharacterized protein n=1 Tax=Candidatus Competibacter denitrificans Run_A_D11 TaxID=1400863 RepID=W6MAI9_9GAMM|nr:hypothetical protein BN873_10029 [Candidatus Competibacter denitrificans Run_A_D11]